MRGNLIEGEATTHNSRDLGVEFTTPAVDLDELVTPRSTLPPLLDVPLEEIIDFLVETGERLALDKNPHMQQCLDLVAETNPLPRRVVENLYRTAPYLLTREGLWAQVESNFPDPAVLDGWVSRTDADGNSLAIRAFPPRMVHMLAGNAPAGCIASIAQGALVKAINLFKMPSSDPFTTVAVDFHPTNKISNVVLVPSLENAVRYVNVATQTIGVYPFERKAELRDKLAGAGGQRVCRVGTANGHVIGGPHDAMYPLHRFVHWMGDDDIRGTDSNTALSEEFGI